MAIPVRAHRLPLFVLTAIVIAVLALLLAAPRPAAAYEPIDLREEPDRTTTAENREAVRELLRELAARQEPAPTATPTPSPTPTPAPTPAPPGYDVSYPQCGKELPRSFSFAIVGVNGGRVHSENRCLGPGDDPSQLEWAGRSVELYANTGNPGPQLSRYWPRGQAEPRPCDPRGSADTVDCAYDYGWNAAAHAYRVALDAFVGLDWADEDADRIPGDPAWWLDVEDANSWRTDRSLNVAALEGAVAFFESMDAEVGFYSTPRLWDRITGGTDAFAAYPAWHAGASNRQDAMDRCDDESFTGGELSMVQWVENGIDANIRCP
ncbi:MAG TPA: hypothetical protein VF364_11170 [Candidatus Limnocylindria bacterium]